MATSLMRRGLSAGSARHSAPARPASSCATPRSSSHQRAAVWLAAVADGTASVTATTAAAVATPTGAGSAASTSAPASAAADVVTVYFRQEGTSTTARPGEDFMEVVSRCKADVPTGCLHGSCGVCEVELFKYGEDGAEAGSPVVMRACVARVPRGWARVEIGMMSEDQVWGQDGWDT